MDAQNTPLAPRLEECPHTIEGWIPMAYFREKYFEEGEDFLVWLSGTSATSSYMLIDKAQWERDEEGGPVKIVGEWRYIPELAHLEPVAFQSMPTIGHRAELEALKPLTPLAA
jgi:hypothetical protein